MKKSYLAIVRGNALRLWRLEQGRVRTVPLDTTIFAIEAFIAPDGASIVVPGGNTIDVIHTHGDRSQARLLHADDVYRIRFAPDAHGPVYSDMRYHGVWDVAIGDRVVRSYAETSAEWRADNALTPWLGGFFAFAGVFCAFAAWLSYDQAARRRRGA